MEMWRKALDMEVPLADEFKIHFLARRGELLDGFAKTAGSWMMVLRKCKATGDDLIVLDALEEEIVAFKDWAEAGITSLAALAAEEVLKDKSTIRRPPSDQ